MQRLLIILGCGLWVVILSAETQTLLKLSTITPGTEHVQLVTNGDFQSQADGWSSLGDMFVGPGKNMVASDNGAVARGHVNNSAQVGLYSRGVNLLPDTEYVLSGYLWNMGDAANHV